MDETQQELTGSPAIDTPGHALEVAVDHALEVIADYRQQLAIDKLRYYYDRARGHVG